MLQRVKKLEAARAAPRSPFEVTYGSFDAFEEETLALIDAGKLGRDDMGAVLVALRRWHADNVWGGWGQRNSGVYSR
jgi:hypothetical protein